MKTTAKHTPGEWVAYPGKNEHGEETVGIRAEMEFIATMDTVSVDGGPYEMPPNAEANARLIAAAPELLDALRFMLCWTGAIPPSQSKINPPTEEEATEAARAAIAKAVGRDA